jgi:hypothetical protein
MSQRSVGYCVLSKADLHGLSNGFRSHQVSGPRLLDFLDEGREILKSTFTAQ